MSRRVLERLLRAMAVGSVAASGCVDRALTIDEGDEGSDPASSSSGGDGPSSPGGEGTAAVTTIGGEGEADAEVDDGDGGDDVLFDIGGYPPPDLGMPPPPVDPSECADAIGNPGFPCEFWDPEAPLYYLCLEPAPGVPCDPYAYSAEAQANECLGSSCGSDHGFFATDCGPDPTVADACCYWLAYLDEGWCLPPEGRPFVIAGAARHSDPVPRSDWAEPAMPNLGGLTPVQREALASAWTDHARSEHASIASFARFVLQLLSLGAPAALVHDAQQALADEIRHAEAAFGLASAYSGHAIGPGPLPIGGSLESASDLETIVLASVHEGCIAETISAVQALEAAREATDPAVVEVLRAIADDELRHAELAWRFVQWGLSVGDAPLRRRVRQALEDADGTVPVTPRPLDGLEDDTMRRHGVLPPARRAAIARAALHEIVAPAATALLRDPATSPRAFAPVRA